MLVGIKMLKSASTLNPKNFLLNKKSTMSKKFYSLQFFGCKLINSEECDKAYFEYVDILLNQATKELANNFDGIDNFYFQKLGISSRCPAFSKIVKQVCVLFHDQTEVEQGYKNKSSMRTNMLENTIVTKRQIKSHLKCNERTASNILISKDMLQSVRASAITSFVLETKKNENKKAEKRF